MPAFQVRSDGHDRVRGQGLDRGHQRGRSPAENQADGLLRHQAHGRRHGQGQGDGGKKKGGKRQEVARRSPSAASRTRALTTFTRQFSTLQDAGLPVLRSLKILEKQMKPGRAQERADRRGRRRRRRLDALRGVRQAPEVLRPALREHGQGRRGRRRPRSHPPAPRRLQGKGPDAQAQDHRRDGLPDASSSWWPSAS